MRARAAGGAQRSAQAAAELAKAHAATTAAAERDAGFGEQWNSEPT